jgi:hypothetical protein
MYQTKTCHHAARRPTHDVARERDPHI